jgi:hypothetical protein
LSDTDSLFNVLRKMGGIHKDDKVAYAMIILKSFPKGKVFDE